MMMQYLREAPPPHRRRRILPAVSLVTAGILGGAALWAFYSLLLVQGVVLALLTWGLVEIYLVTR